MNCMTEEQKQFCIRTAQWMERIKEFPGGPRFLNDLFLAIASSEGLTLVDQADPNISIRREVMQELYDALWAARALRKSGYNIATAESIGAGDIYAEHGNPGLVRYIDIVTNNALHNAGLDGFSRTPPNPPRGPMTTTPISEKDVAEMCIGELCSICGKEIGMLDASYYYKEADEDIGKTYHLRCRNPLNIPQLQSALASQSQERDADGWQPIETAPKDGSGFLAVNGRWQVVCHWHKLANAWCNSGPVYSLIPSDETPTHWQSLPEPPRALAQQPTDGEVKT